jgi:hypothetical protein
MSRRRAIRPPRDERDGPEQLPPHGPAETPAPVGWIAIGRRTTPSARPGYMRLVLTLEVRRRNRPAISWAIPTVYA